MPSSKTSRAIPVDSSGWPIYEVRRAVWKWPLCQHCHEKTARTLLPLDNLGQTWWQDAGPEATGIFLCQKCFHIARSKFGRIMGYTTRNGKTRQHVDEELFGGDI
jgi:5-methylcytosine-specific restriction endonuclease McrA